MATSGTFYGTTSNSVIEPKIVWSATQSSVNNKSTITATLYYSRTVNNGDKTMGRWNGTITIDGNMKEYGSSITIAYNSNTQAITHTVSVEHDADGTKSVTISATGAISGTSLSSTTISKKITLDPFDRVSNLTVSNGTLGTAQTLTIEKANSAFTHTIVCKCGTYSGTICTKSTNTSISWTPPLAIAKQNLTGTSVAATLTITTYNGSNVVGSEQKNITLTFPSSIKPSVALSVSDSTGHASTYGGYIQKVSKLSVTLEPTLSYDSPIKSYKTTANGATYTKKTFVTDVLKSSGTIKVNASVTDGRGRSGSTSKSITVLPYSLPSVDTLSVHRCNKDGSANDQGDYVKVEFSAKVTSLSGQNGAVYKVKYKKTTDDQYTTKTLADYDGQYSVTNGSYVFSADNSSSYDVILTVADDFYSFAKTTNASTGFTLMHWNWAGNGIGLGKLSETEHLLDVGLRTRHFGGMLQPVIGVGTNLNDLTVPNVYGSLDTSSAGYSNCPVTTGFFVLEVFTSGGDEAIAFQRLTVMSKSNPTVYKRVYNGSWGEWIQ